MYGGEEKKIGVLVGGKLKERDHLDDLDVDGRILLKRSLKKSVENVDWIDLTCS
jgi:hypothetical protein